MNLIESIHHTLKQGESKALLCRHNPGTEAIQFTCSTAILVESMVANVYVHM